MAYLQDNVTQSSNGPETVRAQLASRPISHSLSDTHLWSQAWSGLGGVLLTRGLGFMETIARSPALAMATLNGGALNYSD